MLSALAIFSVPIGFLSGGVAFNAWRAGETSMAVKASLVFAACVVVFLAFSKETIVERRDCYTDWDGRSNPTVCD